MDEIDVKFIPADNWWQCSMWKLLTDYTSANGEVNVPTGFITDGASIPFMFRRIFSPTGRYFGAAIVHDYILSTQWDWSKANAQFEQELNALGIIKWRKVSILTAVRLYGWFLRKVLKKA
jgi:hypothetical protein